MWNRLICPGCDQDRPCQGIAEIYLSSLNFHYKSATKVLKLFSAVDTYFATYTACRRISDHRCHIITDQVVCAI